MYSKQEDIKWHDDSLRYGLEVRKSPKFALNLKCIYYIFLADFISFVILIGIMELFYQTKINITNYNCFQCLDFVWDHLQEVF